ncbi:MULTISPECIES: phytoene desaturase family protein [Acidobacterium]|uniref:Phytoene desaturase n=1 Tax=Acidobacterium capsulatum (strain ATCC 51196 / DSM 11244 / BCRC 80197 / JCM 7670 / NBRC 15755 / NCIMB 13165 / 161) TaxID=240015 RepID=C1FAA3_ACIC5|nr:MULTISPECIES: phytoene desaturase family protein [Acidobacterium]ACO34335.1 phytoene desaturase [Acidobacterium capsulatum ATCC 51196]HCT62337.1 phytoene desaturase [Acidobacterium sp.]
MNVAVIGSGLGGLSAAATLAARGYKVTVFEKNSWLGGKAAVLAEDGFRFDMGPTILLRPSVLRRIFAEAGRDLDDYVKMVRLDPQWRCFFDDGLVLDLKHDNAEMAASLDALRPGMGGRFREFMELSEQLHAISDRFFFWRSVGSMRDTFEIGGAFQLSVLRDVMRMRLGQTVGGTIREFIPDGRVAQMLDHYTQYVGSSPDASPAILCAIGHMQSEEGIWYPMGGTRAVPEALTRLGSELGVEYRTSTEVERLVTANGKVTGLVTAEGETFACDAVVSNEDAVRTYRELLGGKVAEKFNRQREYEPACSGVVLYLGLNKRYEHLAHHDFVFSRDPHEEFHHIYDLGVPAPDPTCYLASTTGTEAATAPAGGDALYILVHAPYLRPGQDWSKMLPEYRQVILNKLKRTAGLTDIEDRIVFERALTPEDIHNRYKVLNGAIYGIASHGRWNGAFKPANASRLMDGLFLAGGAAHPGPGMPMVMMSGWIAADAVDRRYRGKDAADMARRKAEEMLTPA